MSSIIIYRSKSGYTKRYMEMLSKFVDAKLVDQSHMGSIDISRFERIIYAAGVYAGKISGLKKFVSKLNREALEKLAIVAVGASPTTEVTIEKLIKDNLISESIIKRGAFFYLQGGFDPDKLNFALRAMLGSVAKKLSKKQKEAPDTMTQEDIDFLNFFQTANDQTSEEQLAPLIDYLS